MLSEGLTQVLIPVAAFIGLGFALLQWFLVSKVRVSGNSGDYSGYKDRLIDGGEEGVDHLEVSIKVAEIQNAISVGELSLSLSDSLVHLCDVLVLMIEVSSCFFACHSMCFIL